MNEKQRYLAKAQLLDTQIDVKLEHIARLRALKARRSPGASGDARGIALRMAEAERELDERIDELLDLKAAIRRAIDGVEDDRCRLILELRYLSGKPWQAIADQLHYDRTMVWRLHVKALEAVKLPE